MGRNSLHTLSQRRAMAGPYGIAARFAKDGQNPNKQITLTDGSDQLMDS